MTPTFVFIPGSNSNDVSGWCCLASGVAEYLAGPEYAGSALNQLPGLLVGDPAGLGALRMNWRTADPELLAGLKDAMLAGGTHQEFLAFRSTCGSSAPRQIRTERTSGCGWPTSRSCTSAGWSGSRRCGARPGPVRLVATAC